MSASLHLTLAGQSYELRPDFANVTALEEFFNRPLLEIAEIFITGEAPLKLVTAALAIILAWPTEMRTVLGEEIVEAGIGGVLMQLQKFFLKALGVTGKIKE